tara:strand:- start:3714 stop:4736 length:1023 start_codon:yes stop_codon:yes gene_type:complete
MGIKNLTSFLKEHCPQCINQINLYDLQGQKAAIDVSIFLYRFKYKGNKLIPKFFEQIHRLRSNNITPIYIFDGPPGPEKDNVMLIRKSKKEEKFIKLEELFNEMTNTKDLQQKNIIQKKIDDLNNKIISVSREDIIEVKNLFDLLNIKYVRAKGEADLLCSKLCTENIVDFVISEDMDLLTSGSNYLLRDFNIYNNKATMYNLDCIFKTLDITQEQFIELCILFGCDYLKRISGLGPKKSFKFIKQGLSIEKIIDNVQENKYKYMKEFNKDKYINDFNKSKHIFMNYDLSYIDLSLFKSNINPLNNQSEIIDYLLTYNNLSYKQIINRLKNIYNTKELSK